MPTRFEVERAVLASAMPMTRKCIMLVLAAWTDNATAAIRPENRKSLSEIARAASAGRSTVARDLDELEKDGWIKRRRPTAEQMRAGAKTGYRLLIPPGCSPPPGLGQDVDYQTEPSPGGGLPLTWENEGGSPPPGRGVVHQRDGKAFTQQITKKDMLECFERFWAAYPRKVGKRAALTEFERACKRASPDKIIAGTENYRDDPNRVTQYTAHPRTWLHRDGWDDDPLPPREHQNGHRAARPAADPSEEWMANRS